MTTPETGGRDGRREAMTLVRWGALAVAVCAIAGAYVHVRNQQVLAGRRVRDTEERIAALRRRIDWHEVGLVRLEQRGALRLRLGELAGAEGFVPIGPFGSECVRVPEGTPVGNPVQP